MILDDIAPVNTGNAFIIDADEISNYNGNESIDQNFIDGYPKQPAWKQAANDYRSRHVFKNNIVALDYDPTTAEYQKIAGKVLLEFFKELQEIAKNQPLYVRAHLNDTVMGTSGLNVDATLPMDTFLPSQYGGYVIPTPYISNVHFGSRFGIGKGRINVVASKTGNINGKYYVIPAIEVLITTFDYTA